MNANPCSLCRETRSDRNALITGCLLVCFSVRGPQGPCIWHPHRASASKAMNIKARFYLRGEPKKAHLRGWTGPARAMLYSRPVITLSALLLLQKNSSPNKPVGRLSTQSIRSPVCMSTCLQESDQNVAVFVAFVITAVIVINIWS